MSSAAKVGLFAFVVLLMAAIFIIKIEDIQLGESGENREVKGLFDSVAGLDEKSPVRIAGVRVGKVKKIGLQDGRALVVLEIREDVELYRDAHVQVANLGMLGDKYVELIPGSAGQPPLADGATLPGTSPASFDEVMDLAAGIGDDVKAITHSLRKSLSGAEAEARLENIVGNVEVLTADLRLMVASNAAGVSATVENFAAFSHDIKVQIPEIARAVNALVAQLSDVVAENRADARASLANLRTLSEKLQTTVDNMNSITGKIASGEGSLGKLVNQNEAHDKLVEALDSVKGGVESLTEVMSKAKKAELLLGFRSEYMGETESGKGAFSFRLTPDPATARHFYEIEAVAGDPGNRSVRDEVITTTEPDGTVTTTTVKRVRHEDTLLLSALYGWNFGDLSVRAGLIESRAGAAVDYRVFGDRVRLSAEAFDFNRPEDLEPHLRLYGRYHVSPALYLTGGYDDPLVDRYRSWFLGAGASWKDDDLKYLLGSGLSLAK